MPILFVVCKVSFFGGVGELQPEGDGQHYPDGDGVVAHLADAPARHLADDAYGLAVQTLVGGAADDAHVAHLAVGAHDETAQDASLDMILIGVVRVFAGLVDKVDQPSLTAGELGLYVHIVIFINLHVGLLGHGIDGSDMANLGYRG